MAGNTENIEAKLAAYIDGDLDAQGRAEIEKHLTANPQHRTLIEQLSKQRDLLRELPREEAPEDIIDALQSHMERSVLLGDDDAGEAPSHMRISRWPQRFAVAAIVMLTVGLGAIIYFVLPRGGGTGEYAAVATRRGATLEADNTSAVASSEEAKFKAMSDMDAVASGPLPAESDAGDRANRMKRAAGADDVAAVARESEKTELAKAEPKKDVFSAKTAANGFGGGAAGTSVAYDELRAVQDRIQNAELARQLKDAPGGLNDNALFVVVNAADPSAAQSQVQQYLELNKIAWDSVSRPMPEPLDISQSQVVHLDRAQQSQVPQMKVGERRFEGKGGGGASGGAAVADKSATATGAPAAAAAPAAPSAAPAAQQQQDQQGQQAARAPGGAVANAGQMRKTSEPISNSITPDAALAEVTARDEAKKQQESQAQQTPAVQQQAGQTDLGQVRGALVPQRAGEQQQQQLLQQQRLIIARNVTRRQAQELSSNLSKQQAVQRAAVYEPRVEPRGGGANDFARQRAIAAPSSQPTTRLGGTEVGQKLALAPQPAPVADESLAAKELPTTTPAEVLPATSKPADVQSTLASTAATPASPATQPAADGPTTAPASPAVPLATRSDAFQFTDAATQPTTPAAAVADERVDLVILVNDDGALLQQPMPNTPAQPQQTETSQEPAAPATTAPANAAPAIPAPTTTESAPATQPAL